MVGFFLKNTPNGNARNDGMCHHFVTQIGACTNENAMGYEQNVHHFHFLLKNQ
jgi:hypothetical protein